MMANTPETGMVFDSVLYVTCNLNSISFIFLWHFWCMQFLVHNDFSLLFFFGPLRFSLCAECWFYFFFSFISFFISCWLCHFPLIQQRNVQQRSVCFSKCICSQFSNIFFGSSSVFFVFYFFHSLLFAFVAMNIFKFSREHELNFYRKWLHENPINT